MKTFPELVFDALDVYAQMPVDLRQQTFEFLDGLELPQGTRLRCNLANAVCYVVMVGHGNTLVFPPRRFAEDEDDMITTIETIH